MKKIQVAAMAGVVILMAACSSLGIKDSIGRGVPEVNGFVYGYIKFGSFLDDISWVELKQAAPKDNEGDLVYKCYMQDGIFVNGDLKPGAYVISRFGGMNTVYTIEPGPALKVEKSGVYCIGVFNFKKDGTLFKSGFKLEKTDIAPEKEILPKVINMCKGLRWEGKLRGELQAAAGK